MNDSKKLSFAQLIPWFLTFFLLLGYVPMIHIDSSTALMRFFANDLSNSLYYFVLSVIFVIYIAIVWIHEKMDPPTRYIIMFGVMLLYAIVLLFIHDRSVTFRNIEGGQSTFSLETAWVLVYTAEVVYHLIFAFGFIFLWPSVKKTPRFQSVLPLVAVAIAFASVLAGYCLGTSPDDAMSYPIYNSYYENNIVFGKVVFAGVFSASVLAYHYRKTLRYVFGVLAIFFFASEAIMALSIAFWTTALALLIFGSSLVVNAGNYPKKRRIIRLSVLGYSTVIFLLMLLTFLPSTSTLFRPYLGTQISFVAHDDLSVWSHYFSLESSWRLILGDGLMGFYRYNLSVFGTAYMVSFNNGFMEAYDAGGVVYLLFYLLLIFVGFYGFRKSEKRNPIFFGLVLGYVVAFLVLSTLSSERLLFSSHYLSFVASYLFSCYTAEGREEA